MKKCTKCGKDAKYFLRTNSESMFICEECSKHMYNELSAIDCEKYKMKEPLDFRNYFGVIPADDIFNLVTKVN